MTDTPQAGSGAQTNTGATTKTTGKQVGSG